MFLPENLRNTLPKYYGIVGNGSYRGSQESLETRRLGMGTFLSRSGRVWVWSRVSEYFGRRRVEVLVYLHDPMPGVVNAGLEDWELVAPIASNVDLDTVTF